jgi:hypothetical protein
MTLTKIESSIPATETVWPCPAAFSTLRSPCQRSYRAAAFGHTPIERASQCWYSKF